MQMGRHSFSRTVRKTSSERRKKEKKKREETKEKKQQQQETNKKWGTGAVQDKPFDELLMFIVGKDSALFSGL